LSVLSCVIGAFLIFFVLLLCTEFGYYHFSLYFFGISTEYGVKDTVNYTSGDGVDTVYNFVRGAAGDVLKFASITAIEVQVSGSNTLFKVGDGISGNSGFGSGTLLLTTSATTGFGAADVNVNLLGATFAFS
jgi:hypothetical protein